MIPKLPTGFVRPKLPQTKKEAREARVQKEIDDGEQALKAAMDGPRLTCFTIIRAELKVDRVVVMMAGRYNIQDRDSVNFNVHWMKDTGLIHWARTIPQEVALMMTNAGREKVGLMVQDYVTRILAGQPAVDSHLPAERPHRPTKTQVQAQAQNTLEGWNEVIRPIEEKGLKLAGIKVTRPKLTLPTSVKRPMLPVEEPSLEDLFGPPPAKKEVVYPPVPKGGPTVPPPIKSPMPGPRWSNVPITGVIEVSLRLDNRDGTFTYHVSDSDMTYFVTVGLDQEENTMVWQFPSGPGMLAVDPERVKPVILRYEEDFIKARKEMGPRTDRGKARASQLGPDRGKPYSSKKAVSAADLEHAVVTHGIEWTIEALAHQCHVFADMEEAHNNTANAVNWRRYANRVLNARIQ